MKKRIIIGIAMGSIVAGLLLGSGFARLLAPGGETTVALPAGGAGVAVREWVEADGQAPAPDLAFVDGDGASLTLRDFAGRHLLVNLWATWCAPCVAEMPSLDRLQAAIPPERLSVVALSLDRNGAADVAPFYAENGIRHLGIYADLAGAALPALAARVLPTSILIGPDGREIGRYVGAHEWDGAEARALLARYLGE